MNIVYQLTRLGLNGRQARVYLAMLQLGPASAIEIAKYTKFKHPTVYDVLDVLEERGLITESLVNGRKMFAPEDPSAFLRLEEERKSALESVLPDLRDLYLGGTHRTRIHFYEGRAGVLAVRSELLNVKSKEYFYFGAVQEMMRLSSPEEEAAQNALKSHLERKGGFYTILVSGSDDGNGNSDTNILVAVDTVNGYVYGVSIPRDSKAVWDGKSHKINAAFGKGGMTKLAEVVSDQLGIPVDYTVSVDLTGFEALVEAIGGVNFDVPINMDYDDPIQNLSIHFKKGVQYLNGADAMRVVRFRHNNDGTGYGSEDLGRMQTQQKFLKAVAKKMLTASNILTKIDDYAKIFNQYVDTDLSVGNLAWLGTEVLKMGVDKIDFSTLPNEWRSPYIYLIPDETLTLVNTYLNPYVEDRTAEDLHLPS